MYTDGRSQTVANRPIVVSHLCPQNHGVFSSQSAITPSAYTEFACGASTG